MRKSLPVLLIVLWLPLGVWGQEHKEALIKACLVFDNAFVATENFQMSYDMVMNGNAASPGTKVTHTAMYKTPSAIKMLLGNEQEILFTPGRMLVINSQHKLMHYMEDTISNTQFFAAKLFESFSTLIDSAQAITLAFVGDQTVCTLNFGTNYTYQFAKFCFFKNGVPNYIYSRFNQSVVNQTLYDMNIVYSNWEQKFTVEPGFPNIEKYILKNNKAYQLTQAFQSYKLHQSLR